MDYEAKSAQIKRTNRICTEFLIDLQTFNEMLSKVLGVNTQDEEYISRCNYLYKLLDQIEAGVPEIRSVLPPSRI